MKTFQPKNLGFRSLVLILVLFIMKCLANKGCLETKCEGKCEINANITEWTAMLQKSLNESIGIHRSNFEQINYSMSQIIIEVRGSIQQQQQQRNFADTFEGIISELQNLHRKVDTLQKSVKKVRDSLNDLFMCALIIMVLLGPTIVIHVTVCQHYLGLNEQRMITDI